MRHYIEVTRVPGDGEPHKVLVNITRIITVAEAAEGCRIHLQGYSFSVLESFEAVCGKLRDAELERT